MKPTYYSDVRKPLEIKNKNFTFAEFNIAPGEKKNM